jgi:hypothetical protein
MPKQRELFMPEMWQYIHTQPPPLVSDDSLVTTRLSEWAQDDEHQMLDNPTLNYCSNPKIFCLEDFYFLGPGNVRLTHQTALACELDELERVIIMFRMQNNGQHEVTRMFVLNKGKDLCFIHAAQNILQWFIRLMGWQKHILMAVFFNKAADRIKFVCLSKLESVMHASAIAMYQLDPVKCAADIILTWSAHSLWVGGCVILHAQGYSASQIQFPLRWLSFSFMDDLHNLTTLSRQQNLAVNQALPNFL